MRMRTYTVQVEGVVHRRVVHDVPHLQLAELDRRIPVVLLAIHEEPHTLREARLLAEVYLALQTGTVDAQENPLTTIEAKKFYEVQKAIMLTGHIVDGLTTQVAPHVWTKLTPAEQKIFTDVTREVAARATEQIKKREAELAAEFKKKGLQVVEVDKKSFVDAVLKTTTPESLGFTKADYDKIVAIK